MFSFIRDKNNLTAWVNVPIIIYEQNILLCNVILEEIYFLLLLFELDLLKHIWSMNGKNMFANNYNYQSLMPQK